MDVIEIDGASNNSVEQIRQLREDCQYSPAQCSFKIYIIDEVHMLSVGAFNALLKTLEEPPSHVKFIFATTQAEKILPTIVSRCQRFEFRPITEEKICGQLSLIATGEEIEIEDTALQSIARLANGGMRDAQSTLDQLISFCGKTITENDVLEVYGLASRKEIHHLASLLAEGNYPKILASVGQLADSGKDLYRILIDLQAYLRELLIDGIRGGGETDRLGSSLTRGKPDAYERRPSSRQRGCKDGIVANGKFRSNPTSGGGREPYPIHRFPDQGIIRNGKESTPVLGSKKNGWSCRGTRFFGTSPPDRTEAGFDGVIGKSRPSQPG